MALAGMIFGSIGVVLCLVVMVVDFMKWRRKKKEAVEAQWAPRPIDANNPPHYMKYAPKPGRKPLRCTVCMNMLTPGDRVLLWPQSGGAMDLLCPACWKVEAA